jgi:hypothetical protein
MILQNNSSFHLLSGFPGDPEVKEAMNTAEEIFGSIGLLPNDSNPGFIFEVRQQEGLKEGYSLDILPDRSRVVISATSSEGARCGIYAFLELIGVRWFSPAEDPILPTLPITLASSSATIFPSSPYRGLHLCAGPHHYEERAATWMSKIKMNRKLTHHNEIAILGKDLQRLGIRPDTTVHSYTYWIPDKTFFSEHPEWFSLIGGKRVPQKAGGQLCLSNHQMRKAFAQNISDYHRTHRSVSVIGICPNDGYGWCECEECKALDTPEDKKAGKTNGRVADFVFDIATRLLKSDPEVLLGHYSYSNFADFLDQRNHWPENLIISCTLSTCLKHAVNDPTCPVNVKNWERLKKIKEKISHVYIYEYYMHRWSYLPAPIWKVVAEDMKAYHSLGVDGFLSEASGGLHPSYQSYHLPFYVAARTLYNAEESWEEILDDYCEKRFGPGKEAMRRYFEALQKGLEDMEGCFTHSPKDLEKLFTKKVRDSAKQWLSRAEELSSQTEYAPRVAQEKKLFHTWEEIADKRAKYLTSQPISPMPLNLLSFDIVLPEEKKIVLLDSISLLPPERNGAFVAPFANTTHAGLLIECSEESMEKIRTSTGKSLGEVMGGECVEIFIAPARNAKTLYHIIVNAGGGVCASEATGSRWNWAWQGEFSAQTSLFPDRWRILFTIPFSSFGATSDRWYFTVVRNRHVKGWEIIGAPEGGAYFRPGNYLEVTPP